MLGTPHYDYVLTELRLQRDSLTRVIDFLEAEQRRDAANPRVTQMVTRNPSLHGAAPGIIPGSYHIIGQKPLGTELFCETSAQASPMNTLNK